MMLLFYYDHVSVPVCSMITSCLTELESKQRCSASQTISIEKAWRLPLGLLLAWMHKLRRRNRWHTFTKWTDTPSARAYRLIDRV